MRNRLKLLAGSAAGLVLCMAAAPAAGETLEQAVATAFGNNPSLESERAFTRVFDEQVTQAKSQYGPNISATATHDYTYTRTDYGPLQGPVVTDDGWSTDVFVQLSQPLFTSGRLAANLDLAEASQARQRENLRATSQDVVLEVVTAYVGLRRDLELYQVAADTYTLFLQQRDLTQSRLRLRDATAPDVDQTQNRLELAAGRVIQARATVEASAARYRNVVGHYPEVLAPLPPLAPLPSLQTLSEALETNNPEVGSAQMAQIGTNAQLASARAQLLPTVTANVTAGRLAVSDYENTVAARQVVAGVEVNVPIYTGGRLLSRVRESEARSSAAQELVEAARRSARASLTTDWNRVQAAEMALPRYAAAVRAAQSAVDGVQRQQTAGLRTLREVLDVTSDLFAARSAAVTAEAERYIAHAAVLRDAGLLNADVFAPGYSYDPDTYRPGAAGLAGMPLRVVLDPLDSLLLMDSPASEAVQREDDAVYRPGQQLDDPLRPISQP